MVRRFLETLFLEGRGRVGESDAVAEGDLREGLDWLAEFERGYRSHLPGRPPALEPGSLRWSVALFYRAAQCLVHRHLGEDVVARDLATPPPAPVTPSSVYSVDLTFRFLPDLLRLARGASQQDPLGDRLVEWGAAWPLSSVGMTLPRLGPLEPNAREPNALVPNPLAPNSLEPNPLEPILADPCLAALYRDRVIAAADRSRLDDARVVLLIREAAGAYPDLIAPLGLERDSDRHLREEQGTLR